MELLIAPDDLSNPGQQIWHTCEYTASTALLDFAVSVAGRICRCVQLITSSAFVERHNTVETLRYSECTRAIVVVTTFELIHGRAVVHRTRVCIWNNTDLITIFWFRSGRLTCFHYPSLVLSSTRAMTSNIQLPLHDS